jgi:hypothetical protein
MDKIKNPMSSKLMTKNVITCESHGAVFNWAAVHILSLQKSQDNKLSFEN